MGVTGPFTPAFLVLSVHGLGLDIDKKILYLYNRRIAMNNTIECTG